MEVKTISKNQQRINNAIRAREVRLVSQEGEQLGIQSLRDALRIAEEANLDLVEISPKANPPVCKIMDYGKFKYEQSKRDKEARKKQKIITVKEVKLRPNIDEHDFQVKFRNVKRFIEGEDKVKVTIMFRGREVTHPEGGRILLNRIMKEMGESVIVERKPRLEGRNMIMVLAPK